MADDMANGNDVNRLYNDALTAQLGERVTNLGRRQSDLESEMRSGFKQMETAVSSLAGETRSALASLSTNIAERNKPQWQAIGVALTFCAMFGGIVWWPVNSAMTDFKVAITTITDKMVTQQEMKWRTDRAAEDRARLNASLSDIRDKQVPREEIDCIETAGDKADAFLQKQIDEIKGELRDKGRPG
jgi:hypothetical protein